MSRGWSIALWGLLALSLFGNAVAVGIYLRVSAVTEVTQFGSAYRALPADVREDIRAEMSDARPEFRKALVKLGLARRQLLAAAQAEPFDPAAYDQAAAEVRAATAAIQELGQDVVKSVLVARTPTSD
jgi:uncharacterized membrane protein